MYMPRMGINSISKSGQLQYPLRGCTHARISNYLPWTHRLTHTASTDFPEKQNSLNEYSKI